MYSNGPPHMAEQKQDDQLEHTYSSYVRIPDVALKTCLRRWTVGKSGERGSGISVLTARHDDDDDDDDCCCHLWNSRHCAHQKFQCLSSATSVKLILPVGNQVLNRRKYNNKCLMVLEEFFNTPCCERCKRAIASQRREFESSIPSRAPFRQRTFWRIVRGIRRRKIRFPAKAFGEQKKLVGNVLILRLAG